jgi:succinoglycan biosynthesis transport protein ExoP
MALEQYWVVIKKWWWLMVASTLVASISSYASLSRVPRIYQAATTVLVGQSVFEPDPSAQDFAISQQLAQTYVNMVQRRPILEGAAEALGLSYVPWSGNVSARIVPGTQLVEITVRDTSPERARTLADEIAQQLILQTPTDSAEEQARGAFVQAQLQSLEENIQITEEEIKGEQARLDAANSARAIQQYQDNVAALQQKLSSYRSTYASLLQTVKGGTNYISVVEPATTPSRPISPRVQDTVLVAAAIGLALAASGAFLIEFLDDTIKTPDDVTSTLDLPTLGAIARIEGKTHQEKLIAARNPRSPIAEAFRALRTSIRFSAVDRPIRTLMVTSSNPVEGKSIVLANLAIVMAQAGQSVIVVDADLRRPIQHEIFGLDNDQGLSNALLEYHADLPRYKRELKVNGSNGNSSGAYGEAVERARDVMAGSLQVITSGPVPPNPADLLASEHMEALIEELKTQADLVIFDTPPVLAVTDAAVLSTRMDGILLLSDAGRTRRAAARQAVERLRQGDGHLLGVVLNRVSLRSGGYYVYPYYYESSQDDHHTTRRWIKLSWPKLPVPEFLRKLAWFGKGQAKANPIVAAPSTLVGRRKRAGWSRLIVLLVGGGVIGCAAFVLVRMGWNMSGPWFWVVVSGMLALMGWRLGLS